MVLPKYKDSSHSHQPAATSKSGAAGRMTQNELLNLAGEFVDLGADVGSQRLESDDACQRYERCGNCVLRKFKTGFISEKSLNHFVAPFRFD
jgi:hypothetical protein